MTRTGRPPWGEVIPTVPSRAGPHSLLSRLRWGAQARMAMNIPSAARCSMPQPAPDRPKMYVTLTSNSASVRQ